MKNSLKFIIAIVVSVISLPVFGSAAAADFKPISGSPALGANQEVYVANAPSPAPSDSVKSYKSASEFTSESEESETDDEAPKNEFGLLYYTQKEATQFIQNELYGATLNKKLIDHYLEFAKKLIVRSMTPLGIIQTKYEEIREEVLEKLDQNPENQEGSAFQRKKEARDPKKMFARLKKKMIKYYNLYAFYLLEAEDILRDSISHQTGKIAQSITHEDQPDITKLINKRMEKQLPFIAAQLDIKPAELVADWEQLENDMWDLVRQLPDNTLSRLIDENGYNLLMLAIKYNCLFLVTHLIEENKCDLKFLNSDFGVRLLQMTGARIKLYLSKTTEGKLAIQRKQIMEKAYRDKLNSAKNPNRVQDAKKQSEDKVAKQNAIEDALDKKAKAHAKKMAQKKALAALHDNAQEQNKKLNAQATRFANARRERKVFTAWKKQTTDEKKRKLDEQKKYVLKQENARTLLEKNKLKAKRAIFNGLKAYSDQSKMNGKELMEKAVAFQKRTSIKKTFTNWEKITKDVRKEKAQAKAKEEEDLLTARILKLKQNKKDTIAAQAKAPESINIELGKELEHDLTKYYDLCDRINHNPDSAFEKELRNLVDAIKKQYSNHAEQLTQYRARKETIIKNAYNVLRSPSLIKILQQQTTRAINRYKERCAQAGMVPRLDFIQELNENLASAYKNPHEFDAQKSVAKHGKILHKIDAYFLSLQKQGKEKAATNIEAIKAQTLKDIDAKLHALRTDEKLEKENERQKSLAVMEKFLGPLKCYDQSVQPTATNIQSKTTLPALTLDSLQQKVRQLEQTLAANRLKIRHNQQQVNANNARLLQLKNAKAQTAGKAYDEKMRSEVYVQQQDQDFTGERDDRQAVQFFKSESQKMGALQLKNFFEKRKKKEVLNHWTHVDSKQCTVREKAILKEEGALALKRFLQKKQDKENKPMLQQAWDNIKKHTRAASIQAHKTTLKKRFKSAQKIMPRIVEVDLPVAAQQKPSQPHLDAKHAVEQNAHPMPAANSQAPAAYNPMAAAGQPQADAKHEAEAQVKNQEESAALVSLHVKAVENSIAMMQPLATKIQRLEKRIGVGRIEQLKRLYTIGLTGSDLKQDAECTWHGLHGQLLFSINNLVDATHQLALCFNTVEKLNQKPEIVALMEKVFAIIKERAGYYDLGNSASTMIQVIIEHTDREKQRAFKEIDLLLTAIRANDGLMVVKQLMKANVNGKNLLGITPLYLAVLMNNEQACRLLLEHGALITEKPNIISVLSSDNAVAQLIRQHQIAQRGKAQ